MLDVIAFFLSGRFNWTRKMLPDRSVRISAIVHSGDCLLETLTVREGSIGPQALAEGAARFPAAPCRILDLGLSHLRALLGRRDGPTLAQAIDLLFTEPELFENLFVVFAEFRGALGRHFRDTVHLNRAADRRGEFAARSFERNDDVIRSQLRVVDYLLRPTHGAERDMDAAKDFVPVRHRLRAKDVVQN